MTTATATDFKMMFDEVIKHLGIDMGDYEFCRSLREQRERRHRLFGFLRLDLLNYIKRFQSKYNWDDRSIVYTGKIYKTIYIKKLNDKVVKTNVSKMLYYRIMNDPLARRWFNQKHHKVHPEMLEEIIPTPPILTDCEKYKSHIIGLFKYKSVIREAYGTWSSETSEKYNADEGFVVKKRILYKTLNYDGLMRRYWSPTNLKYWNKTTMKTSNRGLKADTTWSYSGNYRGGWTFGGITAGDLELFCIRNGFKREKGNKYQYGDYANWFLHILE